MIIVGAGGHAKELALILSRSGEKNLTFFDETSSGTTDMFLDKWPIISTYEALMASAKKDNRFVLGTGNPALRLHFFKRFTQLGLTSFTAVDPSAIIGSTAKMGSGNNIMAFCFVSEKVVVGDGCLINTYAHIHHDSRIGQFCELSPGAAVLGAARIGDYCQLGAKSVVLPKVVIGENVVLGAGSVVNRNLPANCVAVGVPAKIIKQLPPLEI